MTDAIKPVTTPAKGVTDDVLAAIDLSKEPANIVDRKLRLRKLVIQPDGVVPWHSHGDRPAIIYIISGEITEYASNCAVPILHKAGDVAREMSATSHWWKNTGGLIGTATLGQLFDHLGWPLTVLGIALALASAAGLTRRGQCARQRSAPRYGSHPSL